jgi:hypothetical protein
VVLVTPWLVLVVSLVLVAVGLGLSPAPWLALVVLGGFGVFVFFDRDWEAPR